jgi:hypothetical protein
MGKSFALLSELMGILSGKSLLIYYYGLLWHMYVFYHNSLIDSKAWLFIASSGDNPSNIWTKVLMRKWGQ